MAILLTISAWAYAPALEGPFFFDDEHFIQKNVHVHSLSAIPKIFGSSVTSGAGFESNFYRPLQQLIFALTYRWYQDTSSWPYHLLSLLFHSLNGALVFLLVQRLGLSARGALVAAGVFLLHPVQTEAVCYISGLGDPLSLSLMLLGLWSYARSLDKGWHWWRAAAVPMLCMGLALLAKESAVVFAPLALALALYAYVQGKAGFERRSLYSVSGLALVAAAYLTLKLGPLNQTGAFGLSAQSNAYTESLAVRLITFISVLWDYLALIFYPVHLFYEKPYVAYTTVLSPRGAVGLFLLVAAFLGLWAHRRWPRLALGIALVLLTLLPFSGIVPLNAIYLEHWLYVPMIGVGYLVGLAFEEIQVFEGRILAVLAALLVLLLGSYRTAERAADWANIERFYLNEIAMSGGSVRMHNNLGMYYADRQDLKQAMRFYESAIQVDSGRLFPQPLYNLARAHITKNDLPQAFVLLQESLNRDQRFGQSLALMRDIFKQIGDNAREEKTAQALEQLLREGSFDYASFKRDVFDSLLEKN